MIRDRLLHVIKFRSGVFAEIAADRQATSQALGVVGMVSLALVATVLLAHLIAYAILLGFSIPFRIPFAIAGQASGGDSFPVPIGSMVEAGLGPLVAWAVLAGLLTLSSRLFATEPPRFIAVLRVSGFASAPLILTLIVTPPIALLWFMALLVTAVREVGRMTTAKAIVAVVLPLLLALVTAFFALLAFDRMALLHLLA